MDLRRRMELLADSALADREGVPRLRRPSRLAGPAPVGKNPLASVGIAAVRLPGGGSTNLMRVMQTNACSLSCGYCPTFCGGNIPRASISPDETARTFMEVHRKGLASGLFLTSGVPGRPARATDRMLATLDLLRRRARSRDPHRRRPARAPAPAPSRALQRLPAGGGHTAREPAGHTRRARAAPLSGRAPAAAVRLRAPRAGVRRRRQPRSRARSEDGVGARPAIVLPAGGDARVVRGAAARAGRGPGDGARAGGVAAYDDAARPGGSTRRGSGCGARRLLPDAARPPAGAGAARRAAATLRAGRPPHAGAIQDAGAAVRVSVRRYGVVTVPTAEVPSENVAVTVRFLPGAKPTPPR